MTDYTDLIARLQRADEYEPVGHDAWEAAAAIEQLEAERDELAEALKVNNAVLCDALLRNVAAEAEVERLLGALQIARVHVANNAEGWSVSRGAARDDLTIVDAAITTDAAHVNETPKSEHDGADVLTAAQAPAEDAYVKGETAGQMLERLGMDGVKWAAEFRTTALRLGYSDMDEGWLIGWFCNAILAGYDRSAAQAREATFRDGWGFAYRQWQATGSVPDPDYKPITSEART